VRIGTCLDFGEVVVDDDAFASGVSHMVRLPKAHIQLKLTRICIGAVAGVQRVGKDVSRGVRGHCKARVLDGCRMNMKEPRARRWAGKQAGRHVEGQCVQKCSMSSLW
jgi:hypothetical protein